MVFIEEIVGSAASTPYLESAFSLVCDNVGEYYLIDKAEKILELKRCNHYAIFLGQLLIAFCSYSIENEDEFDNTSQKIVYLYELQVDKKYRLLGYGTALLDHIIYNNINFQILMLTAYKRNTEALSFYYRKGFRIHWTNPEDSKIPYIILYLAINSWKKRKHIANKNQCHNGQSHSKYQ